MGFRLNFREDGRDYYYHYLPFPIYTEMLMLEGGKKGDRERERERGERDREERHMWDKSTAAIKDLR